MVRYRARKQKEIEAEQNVGTVARVVTDCRGVEQIARPGDWIITEADGLHHYPCDAATFEQLYERINA